jgi:hypothetical protein
MTSLVSPADVKALINTSMSDANLQTVIDRVEAQITARIGAPQTDTYTTEVVKTMRGDEDGLYLFMPTEIYSVSGIVEDLNTLTSDQYQTWAGGVIERLPEYSHWGDRCVVTYKPTDDRLVRAQVIIDLVRIVIERTAMKSESIAGEYSYTAPDNWDAEFRKAMKKLVFKAI